MSEHKDCVSRADLLRHWIPADVARAECAVEVTRLREALEAARAALVEWGNRPTNSGYERRYVSRAELAAIDAALAEGSDVLPTGGET